MQIIQNVFPTGTLLKLVGVINETFDKAAFVRLAGSGHLVVDFDGVTRVTSFGVREWMSALSAIGNRYVGYINTRPSVMAQFNSVAQFGAPGELLSFYAPYLCPSCGKDVDSLIDVDRSLDKLRRGDVAAVQCPNCTSMAEFDDDAGSYFSYAVNAPRPAPPVELRALLAVESRKLSVDKVIDGSVTGIWLSGELQRSGSFKRQMEGLEGEVVLILDGVQSVRPEGVQQLTSLLEGSDRPMYLARVPLSSLASLASNPAERGQAILLSVQCEVSCPNLHPQSLELDRPRRDSLVASGQGPSCAVCGQLAPVNAVLPVVRGLELAQGPEAVVEFLARRKYPPERMSSGSGKSTPQTTPTGTATPLAPGYFGRYELIARLGTGGMAEVYLARQHGMGGFEKQVVVKRILPNMSSDPAFQNMFLREARLAARVSHPNVVQIFDVGHHQDMYFIAMEHVDGSDLSRLLRTATEQKIAFPPAVAARITADICAGLYAAHSSLGPTGEPFPIIHRDVSPHNVLVSSTGLVKLTDFGIAKAADTSNLTSSDSLKGKVTYMAPELIRKGGSTFDARSDIFPVGIILYQLLTLEHPFKRPTEYGTLVAIIQDEIVDVRKYQAGIHERLWQIVLRALERNPDARYQTARAMQADLESFLVSVGESVSSENIADFCRPLMPPPPKRPTDTATQTLRASLRVGLPDPSERS